MKIKCSGRFSGHLGKHIIQKCKLNLKCQLFPIHACIHKVCLFRHPRLFLVKVHFHHGCYILIEKKPLQGMKEMMVFWRVLIYYSTGFQLTFYRLYPSHLLCHRVEFSSVECPAVLHAHLQVHNAQVHNVQSPARLECPQGDQRDVATTCEVIQPLHPPTPTPSLIQCSKNWLEL